ncbi:MAG: LysM peptidoglycan-binding domain-containing protein [Bacteroidetes bacterium]|nr:LysM peptidoglycan-binding domain-containing protein [Bacteroidota bacterium]
MIRSSAFAICFWFVSSLLCNRAHAQDNIPPQFLDNKEDIEIPTEEQLFKDDSDPVVLSAQIAVRLKKIQQTIPLDYNDHVQKYITYNTNEKRKIHFAKMLGRAEKFFPIYEPIFAKYGIPDEMKYLSVVESALNPFALSRVGASGPWQFMYSTALHYDLNINKYIDERRDPYIACDAAARYLIEMYQLYNDWQLAIASYNCGAGNVNRAIKKAGGSMNFWDIRPYLPAETRAYVPLFIATVYAMKYANRYGIEPLDINRETTQRISTLRSNSTAKLSVALDIPKEILEEENPSLRTSFIPKDFVLNLPKSKINAFQCYQDSIINQEKIETEKEEQLAELAKQQEANSNTNAESKTKQQEEVSTTNTEIQATNTIAKEANKNYQSIAYKVKKGDNLGKIAGWFHCTVKEIRHWNDIQDNTIYLDEELLVYVHKNDVKKFTRFTYLSSNIKDKLSANIVTQEEKEAAAKQGKTSILDKINPIKILSNKNCYQTHIVKKGETLYSIAQKYDDITLQNLMDWNGFKNNTILHIGDKIKVRKIKCK